MIPASAKRSSSISNLPEGHPREWHQRSCSTGWNAYNSDNVKIPPSTTEPVAFHVTNDYQSRHQRRARPKFQIADYDDDIYDGNAYYSEYSDEAQEEKQSGRSCLQSDNTTNGHSDIVLQLLKLLFRDLPPPDPKFVEGLCHNPVYLCFPPPANDALLLPALACPPDGNRSRIGSLVRTGFRHIFPPAHRKNSQLPPIKSRVSTVSLPGGVFAHKNKHLVKHCDTENDLLRYQRWSTVQPPNLMKFALLLQGSDSASCQSSPPSNTPLSSSQPEFTVPAPPPPPPPPPPLLNEADQQASDKPPTPAKGGTVEIGLLKHDITSLEKAIRKTESQLKELDNWFVEQMAAGSLAADLPSSTATSPSSEVSIKQTYKKRNSELKRQLAEMQTRLSDTRYVVHQLETHGLPEGVNAKAFIRRLLADRRKTDRSGGVGEAGRVSGSPKKPAKSRNASPPPASSPAPPQPEHARKTRSPSPPAANPSNPLDVSVSSTGTSSPVPHSAPGMSPSRSFATLPAPRQSGMNAEGVVATTARARTLPSTASGHVISSEAEAITAAWAACRGAGPPYAPVDATNSARATRIKPAPVSPSNSAAALLATANAMASGASSGGVDSHYHPHYTPHQPHPLLTDVGPQQLPLFEQLGPDAGEGTPGKSAKKPRTSMKNPFRFLGRPFRRSGRAVPIPRSLSEENIAGNSVLGDDLLQSSGSLSNKLNKSPSAVNTRAIMPGPGSPSMPSALSLVTDPRGKKNRHLGNDYTDPHAYPSHQDIPVQGKRSQAGSLSSAGVPPGSIHQASAAAAVGAAIDPTTEGSSHRSGVSIDNPDLSTILEVLSGGFAQQQQQPPPPSSSLPPLNSSASSQSGRMPPLSIGTGGVPGGGGSGAAAAAACQSPSQISIPGAVAAPAVSLHNVAAAMVLLYNHCEGLFDRRELATLREEFVGLSKDVRACRDVVNTAMADIEALRRDIKTGAEVQNQELTNARSRLDKLDASAEELRQNFRQDMATIRKEQRRALEPLEYQLATKTRDLQDILTTLNNKFNIMEKSVEQLASPSRDQPRARQLFVHTLTDLGVSFFAFITALIQILIRFLNAGATVTQNRVTAILLNISLLCVLVAIFVWEPVSRLWRSNT